MAQLGNVIIFRSDKDDNFTEEIVQNAQEQENLVLPEGIAAGRHCRCRIKWINIMSTDNLAWEIWLWQDQNGSAPASGDMDDVNVLGRWAFNTSDGKQIAGAGDYFYYIDGLDVVYEDLDGGLGVITSVPPRVHAGGQLHVSLVNRSAGSKTPILSGGYFVIIFGLEPTIGW